MGDLDEISLEIGRRLLKGITVQIDSVQKKNGPAQRVTQLKQHLELTLQLVVDETEEGAASVQNPSHLVELAKIVHPYDPVLSIALGAKVSFFFIQFILLSN
jgi:hypothetical protein